MKKVKIKTGDAWYANNVGHVFLVEDGIVKFPLDQNNPSYKQRMSSEKIYVDHYEVQVSPGYFRMIECAHAEVVDE